MIPREITGALETIDWRALGRTMANPTDNPKQAVLLYAMVTVAVLLSLIVAYLALTPPGSDSPRGASPGSSTNKRRHRSTMTSLAMSVVILSLIISVAIDIAAHVPRYCASCHQMKRAHQSWRSSTHDDVTCIRCHERPGLAGEAEVVVSQLGMVVSYALDPKGPGPDSATVAEEGCRRCHRAIQTGVVGSRTRIPHKQVAELLCATCHLRSGHTKGPQVAATAMNSCTTTCHREGGQTTKCATCHPRGGFTLDTSSGAAGYPKAAISIRECDGCHPIERCTACHGLHMPHPIDYNTGRRHARAGFTDKRLCFEQCHTPADCLKCHTAVRYHGPDWAQMHGKTATAGCNYACHHQNYVMHTRDALPSVEFCDNCHEVYPGF
jgi:cytochrome c nitrite reductase small subunit